MFKKGKTEVFQMKLLIDVPEENQRLCPEHITEEDVVVNSVLHAVKHGINLEQIKTEIQSKSEYNNGMISISSVISIIDKYADAIGPRYHI